MYSKVLPTWILWFPRGCALYSNKRVYTRQDPSTSTKADQLSNRTLAVLISTNITKDHIWTIKWKGAAWETPQRDDTMIREKRDYSRPTVRIPPINSQMIQPETGKRNKACQTRTNNPPPRISAHRHERTPRADVCTGLSCHPRKLRVLRFPVNQIVNPPLPGDPDWEADINGSGTMSNN